MSGLDPGTVVAGSGGGAAGTVSSTVGLLHNKVDKMVRLMVETSENQKKMNKVLQDLLKVGVVSKTEPNNVGGEGEENGERRKRRRERERSSERRDERSGSKRSRSPEVSEAVSTTTPIDHEFEEMKWGLNMALIGDGHWKSFNIVEDIQNIVSRMERKVNPEQIPRYEIYCNVRQGFVIHNFSGPLKLKRPWVTLSTTRTSAIPGMK